MVLHRLSLRPLRLAILGLSILLTAAAHAPQPLAPAERAAILQAIARDEETVGRPPPADDQAILAAGLAYARKALGQRIDPSSVEHMWALEPARIDVSEAFETARREGRLATWMAGLEPSGSDYQALKNAYRVYASLVDQGGWKAMPSGKPLKEGAQGPEVTLLRARLSAEGYVLPAATAPETFDADLKAALARFQARHGLEPDGALGPATRQAMNVPANIRLDQIEANLERLRWLPRPMPMDRMEVDTGAAVSTLYREGRPVLSMRMVVGKPSTRSPMFVSELQAVLFNPPWNVPTSIAVNEVLPKARRQPGYWASEGFVMKPGGGVMQKPGPKNALGQLKIELPSPFGVYLHDTPSRSAFSRPERHLSHGCMRLEKPRELASLLLGWSREQVDAAIATGETKRFPLPRRVPLYVVHRTVLTDEQGGVTLLPDVYGWDSKLSAALDGARMRQAAAPLVSECSGKS